MNNTRIYIALTGDVIQSRKTSVDDFSRLKNSLLEFNRKFHPVVPLNIQAGDEIQGLFEYTSQPISSILWLLGNVYPLKIRCGIGKGGIETDLLESTSEMRGEVFEFSRNAMQYAKQKKQLLAYDASEKNVRQTNVIFKLLSGYLDGWNEMTFRRFQLYSESKTIYQVALAEGVSPEAVNKHVNRTKIRLVLDSVNFLDETIFNMSTL